MEELKHFVPLIVGLVTIGGVIIGVVVWLVRLEAGMKQNASEIRGLWRQRNEDLESHKQARKETNDLLKTMNDKMDGAFQEFREDIKLLLRRDNR